MAVNAAGGDHMRIGDGDVIQLVADDRVRPAVDLATERGPLYFGLAQRAAIADSTALVRIATTMTS
jgi:hypothetical protein